MWQLPVTITLVYIANVTLLINILCDERSGGITVTNF